MLEQLYRYTHENINSLSARKVFSAVLAIYFTVWFNNYWFFDNLKRYIFGVPLFGGRLWILHGMWFKLFIEHTSFESGNYLLIFIGRTGHKLCGLFNIA